MESKLAHRDDLPMDVVAQLEAKMAELYPGYKVVFAGDAPAHKQPDMADFLKAIEERAERSLAEGICIDCGAKMPNYHPDQPDWIHAQGWHYFTQTGTEQFMGWQCEKCDAADKDGTPRTVKLD